MRDLTRDEIEEYLRFAEADREAGDFHQDQAELIGEAVVESGLLDQLGRKIRAVRAAGLSNKSLWLSVWVAAFQMGRECECRLITLALKGANRAGKSVRSADDAKHAVPHDSRGTR
jgi:hypothetical protein